MKPGLQSREEVSRGIYHRIRWPIRLVSTDWYTNNNSVFAEWRIWSLAIHKGQDHTGSLSVAQLHARMEHLQYLENDDIHSIQGEHKGENTV